jgi:molybdenum cofactor cytidylyltransferase
MGEPKALLEMDGESFLALAVRALREGGCDEVAVVVGPPQRADARRIAAAARCEGARVVENAMANAEQIDSLRAALRALAPDVEAVVITPVDLPGIGPDAVRALLATFKTRRAPIVVPTYNGTRGHPTLFARSVFPELLEQSLPDGARSVVEAHSAELEEVPVGHASILHDVNTRAEYRRLLEEEA